MSIVNQLQPPTRRKCRNSLDKVWSLFTIAGRKRLLFSVMIQQVASNGGSVECLLDVPVSVLLDVLPSVPVDFLLNIPVFY